MKINILPTENPNITPPPQPEPPARQRLLLVEDSRELRRINSEKLIASGYLVDAVEDGAVAWTALQLNHYDLLITEQHLPKLSGTELVWKINTAGMTLPIIMATRVLPTWQFTLHPWLQNTIMLLKPHTFDKLLATVEKTLATATGVRTNFPPSPTWQSRPPAMGLRL
jgi:DNA-binding response OmpR family regulator